MRFLALTIVLVIAISSEAKKVRQGKDTTLECIGVNKCSWTNPAGQALNFNRETKTHKNLRYVKCKYMKCHK